MASNLHTDILQQKKLKTSHSSESCKFGGGSSSVVKSSPHVLKRGLRESLKNYNFRQRQVRLDLIK
ncbi:hypothetical protein ES703_23797 [subsurface metagenome]